MKKRFSEEQVIDYLREAVVGLVVTDLCRRHGFPEASYYPLWPARVLARVPLLRGSKVNDPSVSRSGHEDTSRIRVPGPEQMTLL